MKLDLDEADRFQREHCWLGFPLAVGRKYSDDQGGYLAAAVTYYGFFAIFPLLLVLVSVLGFVLHGHPRFERSVVSSALGQFPVIGHELQTHSLRGSGLGLGLGLAGSLWAGTAVIIAMQNAVDQLWGIPFSDRPGYLRARVRAFTLMLVLGAGLIATAAFGELATIGAGLGLGLKVASITLSALFDCGLFWLGFRILSNRRVPWRSLCAGAIPAGIAYECLQLVGGVYIHHVLEKASDTYGTFTLVIGLLTWIYLTVHITLLAAEGNVVATKRLWPRSLSRRQTPTKADELAWRLRVGVEQRRPTEI